MGEQAGGMPHILAIDDAPEDIGILLAMLRAQGWRLSVASDAHQGYRRAIALQPDLILLDVRMPRMDGFTLCRLLREEPSTRQIPVIFLSAAASLQERLEGFDLGAVDYVTKPFEAEEVLARIRIHLQLVRHDRFAALAVPISEQDGEPALLRAARRYIEQNLGCLPSLADIARKVGTYDKRLSALFRQHHGLTVFAYARELRLRRSKELLADSCLSVQDISAVVGFRNACNFTTAFREHQGITPSQFRKQMQQEGALSAC